MGRNEPPKTPLAHESQPHGHEWSTLNAHSTNAQNRKYSEAHGNTRAGASKFSVAVPRFQPCEQGSPDAWAPAVLLIPCMDLVGISICTKSGSGVEVNQSAFWRPSWDASNDGSMDFNRCKKRLCPADRTQARSDKKKDHRTSIESLISAGRIHAAVEQSSSDGSKN